MDIPSTLWTKSLTDDAEVLAHRDDTLDQIGGRNLDMVQVNDEAVWMFVVCFECRSCVASRYIVLSLVICSYFI